MGDSKDRETSIIQEVPPKKKVWTQYKVRGYEPNHL